MSVRDGIATIVGAASSAEERLDAARIARGVAGVRRVDNQLDVDQTLADDPPPALSDVASLEAAVAARLRGDPVLGDRDIRVNADRRRNLVTLTGRVSSPMEKSRAGRLAAEAASVFAPRRRTRRVRGDAESGGARAFDRGALRIRCASTGRRSVAPERCGRPPLAPRRSALRAPGRHRAWRVPPRLHARESVRACAVPRR